MLSWPSACTSTTERQRAPLAEPQIKAAEPVPPLALPLPLAHCRPFPHRAAILLITFVVIFSTSVVQGLSLGPLIHWLGTRPYPLAGHQGVRVRRQLALRILVYLDRPTTANWVAAEVLQRMKASYGLRLSPLRNWTTALKVRHAYDLREKPFTKSSNSGIIT